MLRPAHPVLSARATNREGLMMFAQTTTGSGSGALVWFWIIGLYIVFALPLWAVFKKAGSDMAWAAFIPVLNIYALLKVVGRPGWWLILYVIPIVNIVIAIMVWYDLAKSFGKGVGFTIGLLLLSWIFLAILGWGSARYLGPVAASTGGAIVPPPPPA
jgi:hypothetical protein